MDTDDQGPFHICTLFRFSLFSLHVLKEELKKPPYSEAPTCLVERQAGILQSTTSHQKHPESPVSLCRRKGKRKAKEQHGAQRLFERETCIVTAAVADTKSCDSYNDYRSILLSQCTIPTEQVDGSLSSTLRRECRSHLLTRFIGLSKHAVGFTKDRERIG